VRLNRVFGITLAALAFLALAALSPACDKKGDKGGKTGGADVYAVTRHGEPFKWEYRYWKNGKSVGPFSTSGHSLGQRYEAGTDVYEAMEEGGAIVVKKNGGAHHSLGMGRLKASLNSLWVSGGDVYAAGCDIRSGQGVAAVWKNGKVHWSLTDKSKGDADVWSLWGSGGDVYAMGWERMEGRDVATVWKNGKVLSRLTEAKLDTSASSLCVSGDDVYVGGYGNDAEEGSGSLATVWKNGESYQKLFFPDGSRAQVVHSICVHGGDVYAGTGGSPTVWKNGKPLYGLGDEGEVALVFAKAAGSAPPLARADKRAEEPSPGDVYAVSRHYADGGQYYLYWKNGESVEQFSTDGHSLGDRCDSDGDVYVVWMESGTPIIEKNNRMQHSIVSDGNGAYAMSIGVSGGDIYVGGYENNPQGEPFATVWKNGNLFQRLTDGSNNACVQTLCLSGSDVFAGGNESNPQGRDFATVWKNGKQFQRLGDNSAIVMSLCVSGGDVYAGGYEASPQGVTMATVWKNGRLFQRLTDGGRNACIQSICPSGDDLYVGGWEVIESGERDIPTVGKNGKPLFRLGETSGAVVLVFVK
jgi:hypothetical protein